MIKEAKTSILVLAAGRGTRAKTTAYNNVPKQYAVVAGKPLLRITLETLIGFDLFDEILCVIHPDDLSLYEDATRGLTLPAPVFGGETRQQSSQNGLNAIKECDFVMIHDAARPFVQKETVTALLESLNSGEVKAVIPGLPVTDTLKKTSHDTKIIDTISRENLYAVQTPQAFSYPTLLDALSIGVGPDYTDDAMIMEAAGHAVHIIKGSENNFKVTSPEDFGKAERQLMTDLGDIRVGQGFDVHRFTKGDNVTLCGVKIPHSHSLKGHSDADVAMHALTDALFSAVADGDIGSHFPPSDPQWKGVASEIFLLKACTIIRDKGGMIAHMGITIITESPKIGPHRDDMRRAMSAITQVPIDRISVQATTTEKLGFTGRGEGIAAQASATVRLPLIGI